MLVRDRDALQDVRVVISKFRQKAERSVERREAMKGVGKVTEHMYTVSTASAVFVGFGVEMEWKMVMRNSK